MLKGVDALAIADLGLSDPLDAKPGDSTVINGARSIAAKPMGKGHAVDSLPEIPNCIVPPNHKVG